MTSQRPLLLAAVLGCGMLLAGCSLPSTSSSNHVAVAAGAPGVAVVSAVPPEVTVTPTDGTANVALDTPVVVTSTAGNLTSVSVTKVTGDAATVPGQLSTNRRGWTSTDGLDPDSKYLVAVQATGAAGTHTTAQYTFTTMGVNNRLVTDMSPGDGSTVGVGKTIDLRFNTDIPQPQQASIVKHLKVTSTPEQAGSWHWFSASELHYRPTEFWQAGTKVTLTANFHAINAGNGVWGLGAWSQSFTIGDKHVSLINDNTHQMQVYTNDALVYTWPVSMGKPGFETLEGTLQVLGKVQDVKMVSCDTFGGAACQPGNANYYNQHVYWDTAISTNGYFIHAAPWSVGSQGYADVSHGCVNLSTDRAIAFFNYSQVGDVVQISHTGFAADASAGEGDWQIPAAQYDNTGIAAPTDAPAPAAPGGL